MPIIRKRNGPLMIDKRVVEALPQVGLDGIGLYIYLCAQEESGHYFSAEELINTDLGVKDIWKLLQKLHDAGLISYEEKRQEKDIIIHHGTTIFMNEKHQDTNTPPQALLRIQPGYVYIIELGGSYKIGLSTEPKKRLKQLQMSMPYPLTVIHLIATSSMGHTETVLHTTFASKRLHGEWFALDEHDIAWIRQQFPQPEQRNPDDECQSDDVHLGT